MSELSSIHDLETTTRAARRYGVSPRTLLRWLRSGLLPGIQTAGGHWRLDPAEQEAFRRARQSWPTAPSRPGGPRLVIVEDDLQHATAFTRLLRLLEPTASVEHAADGLSAGLVLGTVLPHVVFVDIELPGLNGIEVIRRARQHPALDQLRYAVVSGRLSEARVLELERLGVRHILPKPITPGQVRQVLDELLATGSRGVMASLVTQGVR